MERHRPIIWGSIASKNGVNDPTHKVPGSRGFVYQRKTGKSLNEPLDGRVYFAGEVYDVYQQMGVPGSILSGFEAIDRLLLGQD